MNGDEWLGIGIGHPDPEGGGWQKHQAGKHGMSVKNQANQAGGRWRASGGDGIRHGWNQSGNQEE